MLIKIKVSSYFEFEDFQSLELFEDYDFVENLVSKKCFLNLSVSQDDLDVYKSLRPSNFEIDNSIKQILGAKKDSIIENVYSNFIGVFVAFIGYKENKLNDYCKDLNVYIGDELFCKKIETDDFFKIEDEKITPIQEDVVISNKYVYFEFDLKKTKHILKDTNLKKINKFTAKDMALNKIMKIITTKYEGEELEQFIYSGEYDWIERIDDEQ